MIKTISRLSIACGAIIFYGFGGSWAETCWAEGPVDNLNYPVVDTGQIRSYDNSLEILIPEEGSRFFGQDAHYQGNVPSYKDNGDRTITDMVTGLRWLKDPGEKKTYKDAVRGASACRTGGFTDWRLPTIKELYSLIQFSGTDPDAKATDTSRLKPFIDMEYFNFNYGDPNNPEGAERIIDSQFATSTQYVHKTMRGDDTMFGVNFADGRIKGYPLVAPRGRGEKKFYVLYVRGNKNYGKNEFVDNQDATITDEATGLTWMQIDSGHLKAGNNEDGKLNWEEALEWAEDLTYASHSDWRLPNAKELQSIVDYTRSPATSNSPAINTIFQTSTIKEGGTEDYPYFWTSTTHRRGVVGSAAVYISFGKGYGWMMDRRTGEKSLLDVHGAGSQRSDPKSGDPNLTPHGRGPQGDVLRIYNFVRCVRGGEATPIASGPEIEVKSSGNGYQRGNDAEQAVREPKIDSRGSQQTQNRHRKSLHRQSFTERLDRDGDGKVSRKEFDGPLEHFDYLDKNGDGFLSENEAPKGPPPRERKSPE